MAGAAARPRSRAPHGRAAARSSPSGAGLSPSRRAYAKCARYVRAHVPPGGAGRPLASLTRSSDDDMAGKRTLRSGPRTPLLLRPRQRPRRPPRQLRRPWRRASRLHPCLLCNFGLPRESTQCTLCVPDSGGCRQLQLRRAAAAAVARSRVWPTQLHDVQSFGRARALATRSGSTTTAHASSGVPHSFVTVTRSTSAAAACAQ